MSNTTLTITVIGNVTGKYHQVCRQKCKNAGGSIYVELGHKCPAVKRLQDIENRYFSGISSPFDRCLSE